MNNAFVIKEHICIFGFLLAMMHKNLTLTAIASILWITMGTWSLSKFMCDPTKGINGLSISDGNSTFQTEDHFMFKVSSSVLQLETGAETVLRKLASYLHANPTKSLLLNGYYAEEELNLSQSESLGLARAEALKSQLSSYGAPDIQIRTEASTIDMSVISKNYLVNAASFTFGNLNLTTDNTSAEDMEIEKSSFDAEDETLPKASELVESLIIRGGDIQTMAMNPSYQHYIDKVREFLAENPGYQLQIIGHTQEMGSPRKNYDQSKFYALTVKKFFTKNGVDRNQIKFDGKGATEFMVGPANPDAEVKNNRVEIEIVEKSK